MIVDRHGHVTEGSSSNILAVREGILLRPLLGTALNGITEAIVLELAAELGIPVLYAPLPLVEVPTWHEAFITSTHRRIVPIHHVNDVHLPASPGPITRRLMTAYRRYEAEHGWDG